MVLVALLWRPKPVQQPLQQNQEQHFFKSSNSTRTQNQKTAFNAIATASFTNMDLKVSDVEKTNEIVQAIEAKNFPIEFHGKIIDQNGTPIPSVKVIAKVRQWYARPTYAQAAHFIPIETKTDLDGAFEINDTKGDGFSFESIQKDGYELSAKTYLSSGATGGNLASPVIFKMWKTGEKAQLLGGSQFWNVAPDGKIYTVDLMLGTKTESTNEDGDLKISISRPEGVSRKDRYNWSFKIASIDGGIAESKDEFMYQAPELGYTREFVFNSDTFGTNWAYRVKKDFFVKTRGHYARINVEVFAYYQNGAAFSFSYAVNPTGSRNLQP